jgi:hypothetical protein
MDTGMKAGIAKMPGIHMWSWEGWLVVNKPEEFAVVDGWCRDCLGDEGKRWMSVDTGYWFISREDAMLFCMAWA